MRLRRAVGQEGRASLTVAMEREARSSTAWAFANEADPLTGNPWPRRKPRGEDDDHPLLQKSGEMRRSIRHTVAITDKSILVMISSSLTKAAVHMRGARMWIESAWGMILPSAKKALWWPELAKPRRSASAHWVTIPRRPFAGLTQRSRDHIKRAFRGLFDVHSA